MFNVRSWRKRKKKHIHKNQNEKEKRIMVKIDKIFTTQSYTFLLLLFFKKGKSLEIEKKEVENVFILLYI